MARPPAIDQRNKAVLEQAKLFGKLGATQQEMADWFECSTRTIERMFADENSAFCRVYKKAFAQTKQSLRRIQIEKALDGDHRMLIWLGKQLLYQKEKRGHETKTINTHYMISDQPLSEDKWETRYVEATERTTESVD